jgi:hypothetical protein
MPRPVLARFEILPTQFGIAVTESGAATTRRNLGPDSPAVRWLASPEAAPPLRSRPSSPVAPARVPALTH